MKKNNNKYILLIYIIFLIISLFSFFNFSFLKCHNWPKGLNNSFIENDNNKYSCNIQFPKYCPFQIGKYFLDVSKLTNVKCGLDETKINIIKFSNSNTINENSKFIGFPITNKNPICYDNPLENFVSRNLININNQEMLNILNNCNLPEIIIDYSKNNFGEMIINLRFNKSLSEERKKNEKNSNPYSNNILILYIDSVSRNNALRQLKKTTNFFNKFMKYKGDFNFKFQSYNFHSFQFFKYHSFLSYTSGNYPILFYGNVRARVKFRFTKYLKENGYITGFSNDLCYREPIQTGHKMIESEICDHEFIICDPNMKGQSTFTKRCLYNKLAIEQQIEYANQFWRKYKNNRKFFSLISNDGHEGTLEMLKYDDEIIYKFIK